MLQVKTEAFILDKVPGYQDEGKISIFSQDFGIMRVIASGLYRPGARLAAWTEPPSWVMADIIIPEGASHTGRLLTLSPKAVFAHLAKAYENLSWYYFYLFLLKNFLPEGIKAPYIYNLWKELLSSESFSDSAKRDLGFVFFTTKLLKNQGFYPSFRYCINCERFWEDEETAYFTFSEQGLICGKCLKENIKRFSSPNNNNSYSLEFLGLLPLKKPLEMPKGVLRISPAERKILQICEKYEQLNHVYTNINSSHMMNDLSIKKARNFMLLFLAPLL